MSEPPRADPLSQRSGPLAARLVRLLHRQSIRRAALRTLVGRRRDPDVPAAGRFTKADIDLLLRETWRRYGQKALHVPRLPTAGARMNLLLACATVCCLGAAESRGIRRQYAIELISDVTWRVYSRWGRWVISLARLLRRRPAGRVLLAVGLFLRFPFSSPGYRHRLATEADGTVTVDVLRCPVAELLREAGAGDLCRAAWCDLDFALAESWGARLERTGTIADGCATCDFRFLSKEPGAS